MVICLFLVFSAAVGCRVQKEKQIGSSDIYALHLNDEDIVVGKKTDMVYIMINLFSYREALLKLDNVLFKETLTSSAKRVSLDKLRLDKYKGMKNTFVEFVVVQNFDEYGDLDFGKIQKVGSVKFESTENQLNEINNLISKNPFN